MSYMDIMKGMALAGNSGGGGGGTALDYSTTEQATGIKWIDGKEIYMTSFDCHENPISTNNGTVADVTALNIGDLISAEMTAVSTTEKLTQGAAGRCVYISGNTLKFYNGNAGGSLRYCTIWYTKAT